MNRKPLITLRPFGKFATEPAQLQAEVAQDAAKRELQIGERVLHGLARRQQRPHLLRRHRFAVRRPEPAHLQKPCDAFGIPAVRLDRHGLQRGLHLPGLHQHGLETGVAQSIMQPMRQRAGFKLDRGDPVRQLAHERNERFGRAGDLRLPQNFALLAENADCGACQRYVETDEDIHVVALSCQGYGPRLSARPREHATRARTTTPESPPSLMAQTSPVSAEPHYGIFAMGVDPSNARRTGQINSIHLSDPRGPLQSGVNTLSRLTSHPSARRHPSSNKPGTDHLHDYDVQTWPCNIPINSPCTQLRVIGSDNIEPAYP